MLLEEAQKRLKKTKITEDQLWGLNSLYILLDLDKDDFCRIVDTVGMDKLLEKRSHYERLDKAEQELAAKERYLAAKRRLEELAREKEQLEAIVSRYKAGSDQYEVYADEKLVGIWDSRRKTFVD